MCWFQKFSLDRQTYGSPTLCMCAWGNTKWAHLANRRHGPMWGCTVTWLHIVQPTMLQHSVYMIFDPRQLDMCSKLPATFTLFPILSHGYAHAQLSSLYPLSTFTASRVRQKNFSVRILERGSLGMRLCCQPTTWAHVRLHCYMI